jgi:hypothetical protein
LEGGSTDFYTQLRWAGWAQESAALSLSQGISIYPPPFTEQGRELSATSRRAVPFDELLAVYDEWARQLADLPDGEWLEIRPQK